MPVDLHISILPQWMNALKQLWLVNTFYQLAAETAQVCQDSCTKLDIYFWWELAACRYNSFGFIHTYIYIYIYYCSKITHVINTASWTCVHTTKLTSITWCLAFTNFILGSIRLKNFTLTLWLDCVKDLIQMIESIYSVTDCVSYSKI